jgi:hypothetical protein
MKRTAFTVLCGAIAFATPPAVAQDKAACLDAASKAQSLRDAHKLVEAREQLRVCASVGCPGVVQSDCGNWLVEVERALPTVVVAAKSPAGADLFDVRVTVDGAPLASKLDGQAVPINAGPHTFHFESAAAGAVDAQVLVKEGEKNQPISVVLGTPAPSVTPSQPTDSGGGPSPWKTVGWVTGGVGVAGLALGAILGFVALYDKSNAHCDAQTNLCDPGTSNVIKTAALLSDIGWIAGGVLLATGAGFVLLSGGGGHPQNASAASARLAPVVTANGGGAALVGRW